MPRRQRLPPSTPISPPTDAGTSRATLLEEKADYEKPLRDAGYELIDEVTKGLNYLVLADSTSTSSKAEKARKLGVEVISEEQLMLIVGSHRLPNSK